MRYWAYLSIIILLIPFFYGIDNAYAATWYNSSWLKARKIQTDPADFTADLTNYPVYINMTSVNIGTDSQADCDDFIFVDHYNTTVFPHEIETCDSTADWAEFWVKVPTAFNANATDIFMYYNNTGAADQQQTQATWDSSFQAVWHLNGTFIDSTSSPITCTNSGTSAVTDEYIGDERSWDAVDDYINCGSSSKIDDIFDGGGTISGWVTLAGTGEAGAGVWLDTSQASAEGWVSQAINSNQFRFLLYSGSIPIWTTNSAAFSTNVPVFWAITYNDDSSTNNPLLYVNGTSVAITQTNADTSYVSSAANDLCVGNQNPGTGSGACDTVRTANGKYDEIRFNNSILTADWLKADYECQKGAANRSVGPAVSCITVGAEGTEPAGGSSVTVSDEYALEDTVSIITQGQVTISDEYALEDSASASGIGEVTVSDEYALEDSASTNIITVSDEFALEDTVFQLSAATTRNAIVLHLNSPTATRLGGIYSGMCDFANNYTMVGIWTNGTIRCMKLS